MDSFKDLNDSLNSVPLNKTFDFSDFEKSLQEVEKKPVVIRGLVDGMKVRHRIKERNDSSIKGLVRKGTIWVGIYYRGYILFGKKRYNNPSIFVKAHCRDTKCPIHFSYPVEVEINGVWVPYKNLI